MQAFPTERVRLNAITNNPADPLERKKLRAALRALAGLPRDGIALDSAPAGVRGQAGVVGWEVLAPDQSQLLEAQARASPNHASVITRLTVGDRCVLLTGDADADSWQKLMDGGADLTADALGVSHHGGPMTPSTLRRLLGDVGAEVHIVSVGTTNSYGHPAATTLEEIRNTGRGLLCTQLNAICAGGSLPTRPCAGTVRMNISDQSDLAVTPDIADHRAAVESLPDAQCIPVEDPIEREPSCD